MNKAELANFAVPYLRDTRNPYHSVEAADKIAAAQKFVLDGDFAAATINVMRSKPSSLISTVPLARMPYSLMWIELSGKERFYNPDCTDVPMRVGFLIESIGSLDVGYVTVFQMGMSPSTMTVAMPCFSWVFDNSPVPRDWKDFWLNNKDGNKLTPEMALWIETLFIVNQEEAKNAALYSKEHFEVVEHLYARDLRVPNKYLSPAVAQALLIPLKKHDPFAEKLLRLSIDTTRGDNLLIRSVLAILNSKNTTQVELVDNSDWNKKRAKKGQKPMYDFHILKLKMNEKRREYLLRNGVTDAEMRASLRRGHPKVRKTGIFWWSAHLVGRIDKGFIDKEYHSE